VGWFCTDYEAALTAAAKGATSSDSAVRRPVCTSHTVSSSPGTGMITELIDLNNVSR
jgi:hypothetical protein